MRLYGLLAVWEPFFFTQHHIGNLYFFLLNFFSEGKHKL